MTLGSITTHWGKLEATYGGGRSVVEEMWGCFAEHIKLGRKFLNL